jgi:hypothetical protein
MTTAQPSEKPLPHAAGDPPNGAALAAFVASGIGAFAVGLFVILNEAAVFTAPTLYGPAGGVSGRTSFAVGVWLIAWAILHRKWVGERIDGRAPWILTLVLIGLGVIATFPPVWALL